MKIMSKKIILIIVLVIIIVGFVVYRVFLKKEESAFILEEVSRGTVLQEISETGLVKVSEKINLGFKNSGRLERIFVAVGDSVEKGKQLAKLDTAQLYIQLREAQANLEITKAQKDNTQVSLESALKNLEDVKSSAEKDLNNAYEDGLNSLNDAYLKIYNSFAFVNYLKRTYFERGDAASVEVLGNKDAINNYLEQTKTYLDKAKNSGEKEDIDNALLKTKEFLINIKKSLESIRNIVEGLVYRDIVSSADRTSLESHTSYINTAYDSVVSAAQNISTTKITNQASINTAQAGVNEIQTQLEESLDSSSLYQAKIKQAEAQVSLLQNKIQDAFLNSPSAGQIIEIKKREGEIVQPTDVVILFLLSEPFQIKADIYEEDIVKVKIGNAVDINFAAVPDKTFEGEVISINPAEKVVNEVVYYEITIDLKEEIAGLKPGMTADIDVKTGQKENVLIISRGAVEKINRKEIVRVFKDGAVEEREIEVGLRGNDFFEVVSGLTEGEKVIIGKK